MKRRKLVLLLSLLYSIYFIGYVIVYNIGWLDSISKSSKYLEASGDIHLFAIFIFSLAFAMVYNSKSWIVGIGGPVLAIIATYTGWSLDIGGGLEDNVHVICTFIGIISIAAEIIRQWLLYRKKKESRMALISFVSASLVIIPSLVMWAIGLKNHTFWIEVDIIFFAYLYYFIKPI